MKTVEELKDYLGVHSDAELAARFGRGASAVSNWRRDGKVPPSIIVKATEMKGSGNQVITNMSTKVHSTAESEMIDGIMEHWEEKKRKKLLMVALQMDDE